MADSESFIVWPAPGLPALIHGDRQRLSIVVATSDRGAGSIARWAEKLAFRAAFGESRVPAVVEAVSRAIADLVEGELAQGEPAPLGDDAVDASGGESGE